MVGGVQRFGSLNLLIIIRHILQTYSYIFVAQAVIPTGKCSLKRREIKQITKEKKRKDNRIRKTKLQKGNVKIRKEKENIKENQQAAVDKSLPGVQVRCAVSFSGWWPTFGSSNLLILIWYILLVYMYMHNYSDKCRKNSCGFNFFIKLKKFSIILKITLLV